MANAKKIFKDTAHASKSAALAAMTEIRANMAEQFGIELFDILQTNVPQVEFAGDGDEVAHAPGIGLDDESGAIALADPDAVGSLVIVTHWHGPEQALAQPEGAPLAVPSAIFLLSMPTLKEVLGSEKLNDYREQLVLSDLLAKGRKIARGVVKDGKPLIADRMGALIAAAARSTASGPERSFNLMFPHIQGALLHQVTALADRLKQNGQHAAATQFRATYSKARLSKATMQECFASSEAAAIHFPQMPQTQWETLLKFAVKLAERCPFDVPQKDAAGQSIKDAEGKIVRERIYQTLSPEIFLTWIETRDERARTEAPEEIRLDPLDVSELMADMSA